MPSIARLPVQPATPAAPPEPVEEPPRRAMMHKEHIDFAEPVDSDQVPKRVHQVKKDETP